MTKSPPAETPRPLDRALTLSILDDTYRVAAMDLPVAERSALLTIALREHVSAADAENKMKKTVTRIWLNPPEPAVEMIDWAKQHPEHFPDRRVMHTGALLATTPFVASVMAQLGRSFSLAESITVPDLRRRMVAVWGGTSTVEEAAGKTITTLRRLEILDGGGRAPISPRKLQIDVHVSSWLIHATMLARQVQSIDVHEVPSAPELFWLDELSADSSYPFLESHAEGMNRRVWTTR